MTVLCLGEPLVTLTPPPHTSLAGAETAHLGIGGAELNVAVHLARMGVEVAYAGAVGSDPFGSRIRTSLQSHGVDCDLLMDGDGPTGLYCKEPGRTLYYRSDSAGSRFAPLARVPATVNRVHLTGVTFGLTGAIVDAASALCGHPRPWSVSFDVNYRPALWSATSAGPALLDIARRADIVFVGRDEAEALWRTGDSGAILDLVGTARELVIKDGEFPVDIWADGCWHRSAPGAVTVAEPVGAGDAFAAAYLAARWSGADPTTSAEAGHRLAAQVMTSVSDQGDIGTDRL